jgi:hypothetical protein
VKDAVAAGTIAPERLAHYVRLQRELDHLAVRQNERQTAEARRKERVVHRAQRQHKPRA